MSSTPRMKPKKFHSYSGERESLLQRRQSAGPFSTCQDRAPEWQSLRGGDAAQAGDQELAPEHENNDPRRHEVGGEADEEDESGGNQEFIRHGIKENSYAADLAVLAREVASRPSVIEARIKIPAASNSCSPRGKILLERTHIKNGYSQFCLR